MAYSIGGIPVILNTRAIEAVSIKLGTGDTVNNIINSGIDTAVDTGALITDSAFNEVINPIIANVADAINPTDADFSSTVFEAASLEALTGNIVATVGQFQGNGTGLTNLPAGELTGVLPALNAAALTDLSAANITPGGVLPVLDGSALTGVEGTLIPGSNIQAGVATATEFDGATTGIATNLASVSATTYYGSGEFLTDLNAENALTVTLADESVASGSYPLTFAASGSGDEALLTNAAATIDPATGQVTLTQQLQANNGVNETSDARLKENVQEIEGGLEKVKSLRGVTFDWNEASGIEGGSVGVIAQELLAVLPEAVNTSNEEKYTVNYNGAIALLISAVKELSAEVEALKAAK